MGWIAENLESFYRGLFACDHMKMYSFSSAVDFIDEVAYSYSLRYRKMTGFMRTYKKLPNDFECFDISLNGGFKILPGLDVVQLVWGK